MPAIRVVTRLQDLDDVNFSSVADKEFLQWDNATGKAVGTPGVVLTPDSSARNTLQPPDAAVVPLTLKGAASQSADLLQLLASGGSVLAKLDKDGKLTLPQNGLAVGTNDILVSGNRTGFGSSPTADKVQISGDLGLVGSYTRYINLRAGDTASNIHFGFPDLVTGAGAIHLFRYTNTSGVVGLYIYKGDNSVISNHGLLGNANSYLCKDGRFLGIGSATTPFQRLHLFYGHFRFEFVSTPGACTAALAGAGAGNLSAGAYTYKVTYVTAAGETTGGTTSNSVTVVDPGTNGQISLTGIPTSTIADVTARKLYRTTAGGSTYKLLATLNDNTTTTYTDNIADGSLGATVPTSNTTAGAIYAGTAKVVTLDYPTARLILNTDLSIDAGKNVVLDTATGTKFGTASTQKIGFLGATPAVQQTGGAATAGGTYGATEQSMLQKAYDCLRTFGFLS
ncbi:MAG: hypothetical protein HY320_01950 [Armatimonadetes bacterium]|nr:hypothetical protein [Armatimonadota bacterium]